MNNSRLTPKERNLLKGSIRRVFSRSELRREVLDTVKINHSDSNRPRVKKWSICNKCSKKTPSYLMVVDHKRPLVPLDKTLEDMSWDEVVNNTWCEKDNLDPICKDCHDTKSKEERKIRKEYKDVKQGKRTKRTIKADR